MTRHRLDGGILGVWLAIATLAVSTGWAQEDPRVGVPPPPPRPPQPFMAQGPEYREAVEKAMGRFPGLDSEEVMRFIREEFPREVYEVQNIAHHHVQDAADYLSDLVSEALAMLDAKEKNPERFKLLIEQRHLEQKSLDLARALREIGEDRQPAVHEQLRKTVEEAFDVRQELIQKELEALEQDIGELRGLIERRHDRRAAIIQHRLDELTGVLDGLDW